MKPVVILCFILLAVMTFGNLEVNSQVDESTMKAVAVEKIVRFLEWPKGHPITKRESPFIIGTIGECPFGEKAAAIYENRKIKGLSVQVRTVSKLEEINQCHLLYITPVKPSELKQILAETRNQPILTFSNTQGYAEQGVLVNFYIENKKLRFEINEGEFHKAGITIDSLLLKVAKNVNPVRKME